jgi:hypothetical protein
MRVASLSAAVTHALFATSSCPVVATDCHGRREVIERPPEDAEAVAPLSALQAATRLVPSTLARPNLRSVNSAPLVTSGLPLVGRFLASCGGTDKYVISFTQHRADRRATAT